MKHRLALALLSLAACGDPPDNPDPVLYDPCSAVIVPEAAEPAELASVGEAVAIWNRALGGRMRVAELPEPGSIPVRFRDAAPLFLGFYDDEGGAVLVNRRLGEDRARAVTVAHELGHAFGLAHVERDRRASIMNPANVDTEPTAEDVLALEARWGGCR